MLSINFELNQIISSWLIGHMKSNRHFLLKGDGSVKPSLLGLTPQFEIKKTTNPKWEQSLQETGIIG